MPASLPEIDLVGDDGSAKHEDRTTWSQVERHRLPGSPTLTLVVGRDSTAISETTAIVTSHLLSCGLAVSNGARYHEVHKGIEAELLRQTKNKIASRC
ncbi:hypothetical protein E2562_007441 [Oryza meyeriana var. granulata]|uniref:Uncharacterized protein n=1 Tax=Oryza meyeriana var. granulata TaxID=110450 RepID=A0A6G1CYY3_9ORYZ|nr:hypothetical protein E2562_007441 [Oryza meyeriana var. granulata]